MQEKTIKSILRRKLDDWCDSIEDMSVKEAIQRDAICTGGAIASMLMGEKPNDFDFYFKTEQTTALVARHYLKQFKQNPPSKFKNSEELVKTFVEIRDGRVRIVVKSQGIASEDGTESYQYFEGVSDPTEPMEFVEAVVAAKDDDSTIEKGKKYRPVFLTSNAISLSNQVQIVIRFYGSVDEIHENYDFIHCTCAWEASTGSLRLPNAALVSLLNKRLKYKTSKYPLCSIIRTRKFLQRGWHIDAGQYVKMAWDLNKLDLNDINTLEDQMVGVDSAYFHEVIGLLKAKTSEGEGKAVEDAYLMEVVDKVFG